MTAESAGATAPELSLEALEQLISLDAGDIEHVMTSAARHPSFMPIVLREDLSWRQVATIEVNAPDLPGVNIFPSQRRFYRAGSIAAHLVGYVGQPNEAEIEAGGAALVSGTLVGKTGLEKAFDAQVRGEAGLKYMEVNVAGRPIRELSREPATPGQGITTTPDLGLQEP